MSHHTLKSEEIINFIEDYRKLPLLWDYKHKNYVNKKRRNDALKVLGTKYNMTTEDVKKKIKCLRSYYCKERTKTMNKRSGAGTDETFQSTWFAYNNMSFLSDITTTRDAKYNIENE
ncbi:uncharacterized protein LOC143912110 [Arctopsyche grandis]|uniref:uncharacterized protein LOC143912110 n=1 Tax=Arctopsyche grandis TaxID=121162 RepID=UPI00406D9861